MSGKIKGYIIFTAVGLLLGYLIFGTGTHTDVQLSGDVAGTTGKWTCSMHPEINGKENGTCPICAMDLVYQDDAGESMSETQFEMTDDAIALADIQTSLVEHSGFDGAKLTLSGVISTNEETDAVQTTLFDGRLEELYTNVVGKKVGKGQEIGKVYSPELFLAQDKLLTSASYKQTHPKLYAAARNTLGLWKMTDEQVEQMLKEGKPTMYFPLYADVNGTITEVLAKEGDFYPQGAPLFKVSDLRKVWAVFDAYESQLGLLREGQEVEIHFEGYPGKSIKSSISFLEPVLKRDKRTLPVRVILENKEGLLRPGMFARAEVTISTSREEMKLTVPKSAVLWTGKRSIVYKKHKGGHGNIFEMVVVSLGSAYDDSYQILDGLQVGDEVVTNGTFTVDAAAQLKGKKSMINGTDTEKDMDLMPIEDAPKTIQMGDSSKKDLERLLDDYMVLKNALVNSDSDEVVKASHKFMGSFADGYDGFPEAIHDQLEGIHTRLGNIIKNQDIDIQRKEFKHLSESMIMVATSFSDHGRPIYLQHCNCVDNFTGGDWLSLDPLVVNPYFGDKMLHCGKVTKVLH